MSSPSAPLMGFVAGSGSVVANLDALLESGLCVYAVTRNGKSNLIRVALEQTYGEVLQIVLDPDGEYSTLRSPERPYLVVGKGRDVELPLDDAALRRFVLTVIEKKVSVIVDMHGYDVEDEQQLIVSAVCSALVSLPENHPGNALLVIEELQDFAPEGGGKNSALRAVRRLAKRGLKRGVAIVGSTQRISDVSKGVITMLKSKAIGGTDPIDVKRALDALGLPPSEKAILADLPVGHFYVKGPAFGRHASEVTLPRSLSAPPKRRRGEAPAPTAEAPAEITALAAALAASVARDQSDASTVHPKGEKVNSASRADEETMAARIVTEREQAASAAVLEWRARLDRAVVEASHRMAEALRVTLQHFRDSLRDVGAGAETARQLQQLATYEETERLSLSPASSDVAKQEMPRRRRTAEKGGSAPAVSVGLNQGKRTDMLGLPSPLHALKKSHLDILGAVAWYNELGVATPSRAQLAAAVQIAPENPIFRTYLGGLRKRQMIAGDDSAMALTAAGRTIADSSTAPRTLAELHSRWRKKLPSRVEEMFNVLVAAHPRSMTKSQLAGSVGVEPTNPIFRTWFGQVRNLGMFDDHGESASASALLFPKGLPNG